MAGLDFQMLTFERDAFRVSLFFVEPVPHVILKNTSNANNLFHIFYAQMLGTAVLLIG